MGINEPFRCIVAGHRLLLAVFVIAPLALVAAFAARGTNQFAATSRIQATSDTLGSDTEADSVLNRVRGIATSTDTVRRALADAKVQGRDPAYIAAHEIALSRLGSSGVVDIIVTDPSADVARSVAGALGSEVVRFLNGVGSASSDAPLQSLQQQEQKLVAERNRLVAELGQATSAAERATISAQMSALDQQRSDLTGAIQQLEVMIASDSSAAVISPAGPAKAASSSLPLRLVLAGIGGLVAGLLIAALLEIIRPRLADARAVAREVGAPLLGTLVRPTPAPRGGLGRLRRALFRLRRKFGGRRTAPAPSLDADTALALRRAAAGAHVGTVALIGAAAGDQAAALARALTRQLAPASVANGRAGSDRAPSPRGSGGVASRSGPGGVMQASRARTQEATRQIVAPPATTGIRVATVADIGGGIPGERYGLLVTARALMRTAEVGRVSDLATATGWPIVGVLDIGS